MVAQLRPCCPITPFTNDYCDALYMRLPFDPPWTLQMVQNDAAHHVLTEARKGDHLSPVRSILVFYWCAIEGTWVLGGHLRCLEDAQPLRSSREGLLLIPSPGRRPSWLWSLLCEIPSQGRPATLCHSKLFGSKLRQSCLGGLFKGLLWHSAVSYVFLCYFWF